VKKWQPGLLIVLLASALFIPFLGSTHLFDWDEVNFAEASREMIVTHNYFIPQINFEPFWEKPPLFFWLQILSMKLFGVNEFAARFPNAVCGIITLLVLYRIGKKLVNPAFGWIWILVYAGSLLPQFYFKSGIIDPWFNLFIFLSVCQLFQYSDVRPSVRSILLSGLFAGLAVMTKGPVALLIIGLCYAVHALLNGFRNFIKFKDILLFLLLAASVGSIWFIALLLKGEAYVIRDFFNYQVRLFATEESDHGGPFYYHFLVLLIGCFPAAVLSLLSMRKIKNGKELSPAFHRWMLILFWVVLILFSIVKTKIIHYSSLCYYPLTYLAAVSFYQVYQGRWRLPGWFKWLQFFTGLLVCLSIIALSYIDSWKGWLVQSGMVHDPFANESLMANVVWSGFEKIPGFILLAGLVGFILLANQHQKKALLVLFAASAISFNLTIVLITPKVEQYAQGAAIEFFKSKATENSIVETIGFKSYAHLYYARRTPGLARVDSAFLQVHPEVGLYFVGKIQNLEKDQKENPRLQLLYKKNGFVFYQQKR
jgi:4-amino-4-deoxy-L-arabinose transferase-like glycosyltransferase